MVWKMSTALMTHQVISVLAFVLNKQKITTKIYSGKTAFAFNRHRLDPSEETTGLPIEPKRKGWLSGCLVNVNEFRNGADRLNSTVHFGAIHAQKTWS